MASLKKLLLVSANILVCATGLIAQDGKKFREPAPNIDNAYVDRCRLCDSLAGVYLLAGDTSMAMYYYQQYIDAHFEEVGKNNTFISPRVSTYDQTHSFYLAD